MSKATRLTDKQISILTETFLACFMAGDQLWLFGSRIDPSKKGGDIDLYIETNCDVPNIVVEKKIVFLRELKKKLGEQKIDVIINALKANVDLPIYTEAKNTGIKLA